MINHLVQNCKAIQFYFLELLPLFSIVLFEKHCIESPLYYQNNQEVRSWVDTRQYVRRLCFRIKVH